MPVPLVDAASRWERRPYEMPECKAISLERLIEASSELVEAYMRRRKAGFRADQPRAPAGSPDGGQWVDGGGGGGGTSRSFGEGFRNYLSESAGALAEGVRDAPEGLRRFGRDLMDDLFSPGGALGFIPGDAAIGMAAREAGALARLMGAGGNAAVPANRVVTFTERQLQRKYKHAADFWLPKNYNRANGQKFKEAVDGFVKNSKNEQRVGRGREIQPSIIWIEAQA